MAFSLSLVRSHSQRVLAWGGLATTLHFLITDCNAGLNVNDLNTDRCLTFDYKSELNVIDYKYNLNT